MDAVAGRARLDTQRWQRRALIAIAGGAALAALGLGLNGHPAAALRVSSGAMGFVLVITALRNLYSRRPNCRKVVMLSSAALQLAAIEAMVDVGVGVVSDENRLMASLALSVAICGLASAAILARRPPVEWTAFATQTVVEAVLIASALSLAAWRWGFNQMDADQLPLMLLLGMLDAGVVGLAIIAITLNLDKGISELAGAVALISIADALSMYWVATDHLPWLPRTLALAASVLLVHGLDRIAPMRRTGPDEALAGYESRRFLVTWTSPLAVALALVSALVHPTLDRVSVALAVVFLLMLGIRDVVQSRRFRRYLLHITRLASRDPLTGLPNRRALREDVADGLTGPVSVLVIDLDQFKAVNDLIGHSSGDAVLVAVADTVQQSRPGRSTRGYRLGGDEFALIVEAPAEDAEGIARTLIDEITAAAHRVPGVARLSLGASVGVHHLESPTSEQLSDALVQSGHAMRAAKNAGKGRVHVFDEQLRAGFRRRTLLEARLREHQAEVGLEYQPIVETDSGRVAGYESLARWYDRELGSVPATEFIDVADHSGLIVQLGDQLMERAVAELTASGCLADGRFAGLNVSALQLLVPGFAQRTLRLLRQHDLPPEQLLLEVTESRLVSTDGIAHATMRELATAGVQLAIDDFGAGSTSVGNLRRLPLTTVKIDRSLSADLDLQGSAIVHGVTEMCRGLGLRAILEGVETPQQLALARRLDVQYVQGWLFGQAVPLSELAALTTRIEAAGSRRSEVPQQA